jgi:uncharacterized phage protein (TIGR01671 family)
MHEILFRGKRRDTGRWEQGFYLCLHQTDEDDLHIIVDEHGEYNPIDPHTLGQFTGFTDQQGEKIFEGDILLHEHELYTMGFIEKYGRYAPTKPKCVFAWFDIASARISGNVHDDKGLVGGEGA